MVVWNFCDVKRWIKTYLIHALVGSGYGDKHHIWFSICVLNMFSSLKISHFSLCLKCSHFKSTKTEGSKLKSYFATLYVLCRPYIFCTSSFRSFTSIQDEISCFCNDFFVESSTIWRYQLEIAWFYHQK